MKLHLLTKHHELDNIWTFRFEPTGEFNWTAGQFMQVELKHDNPDDEGTQRYFTVASAPYEKVAQITTRVTDSTFKQALDALPIGGELDLLEAPDGEFVWTDSDKPLVFVAGGIGVTPFHSILTQRAHEGKTLPATLIYGNRTDQIVFKDLFDQLAVSHPEFSIRYVTGEPITAEKLHELVPDLNEHLAYVSGPEPMVDALGDALKAKGLAEDHLKQDWFPNYTATNY